MSKQFIHAIVNKNKDELTSLFGSSVFFRDKDAQVYTSPSDVVEKLITYAHYPFESHTQYGALDIIKISDGLYMKVKTKTDGIHKIYIREVPKDEKRIRIDFSYDGSHYHGLQRQNNKQPTIQKEIEGTLRHILQHDITVAFAGRTDKGVHALHQVGHIDTTSSIPPEKIQPLMNTMLPNDIHIQKVSIVPPVFHARYDCYRKTYRYVLTYDKSPYKAHYAHYIETIDIDALNAILKQLKGTHDFIGFSKLSYGKLTERTISSIEAKIVNQDIHIEIESEGFLRHMVRIIVGNALKDIIHGTTTVIDALNNPSKNNVKYMAPPQGLYLTTLYY